MINGFELIGRDIEVYRGKKAAFHTVTNPRHVDTYKPIGERFAYGGIPLYANFSPIGLYVPCVEDSLEGSSPVTSFCHHNNNQILQMFTININLPLSCKIIAKQTGVGILELLHCNIYNCILKNHSLV